MRSLFLANSSGGKTTLIVNLLLNKWAYRDVFSAIYVFSPSVHHDGTWGALKEYVRDELNKKEEEHFSTFGMARRCNLSLTMPSQLPDTTKITATRRATRSYLL